METAASGFQKTRASGSLQVNTFGLSLCEISVRSSLLALGGDDSDHLVALFDGAAVLTETGTSHLHGLLFLSGDLGTQVFDHLAFVGGEASNLSDDATDSGDTGVKAAGTVALVLLE